jgi:hypothetical protein
MRLKVRLLLCLMLLCISPLGIAQVKVPVFISSTIDANDVVGQRIVSSLKEAIRGSNGFRLVEDGTLWPYLKFVIITLGSGNSTSLSWSIIYDSTSMPLGGAYMTGGVQNCGIERASSCAQNHFSAIDRALESLQRENAALRATLK